MQWVQKQVAKQVAKQGLGLDGVEAEEVAKVLTAENKAAALKNLVASGAAGQILGKYLNPGDAKAVSDHAKQFLSGASPDAIRETTRRQLEKLPGDATAVMNPGASPGAIRRQLENYANGNDTLKNLLSAIGGPKASGDPPSDAKPSDAKPGDATPTGGLDPAELLRLAAAATKDGAGAGAVADPDPAELLSVFGPAPEISGDPAKLLEAVRGLGREPMFDNPADLLALFRPAAGETTAGATEAATKKNRRSFGFHPSVFKTIFGGVFADGFFADAVVTEVSPQQLALGVILMACVYMHGWSLGRDEASDLCAQGPESCGAVTIVWTMFVSTAKSWVLILFLLIVLLTIEIAVIGVLRRSIRETAVDVAVDVAMAAAKAAATRKVGFRMLSVRVLFSWLLDPRMLLSIGASFASAAAFAAVYSTLLGLKDGATADDFRACAQNSYAFQIVAFVAFVVAQF